MGAWGAGSFENDDALDFLVELTGGDNLDSLADWFQAVLDNDDFIEADEARIAIAAAEVVAWLRGAPGVGLPEGLVDWLQDHPGPVEEALAQQALRAVEKLFRDSELRLLWEETTYFADWQAAVLDLVARLKGEPA